jgi:hypothetical protein
MAMTREQLLLLAKKIRFAEADSEKEMDEDIELFLKNVPDPHASDYFFSKKFEGMTLEEIVDKALSYKPNQL